MAGFIMRQTKWLGTGVSGNDNDKRARAQEILQKFANLLLDTHTGWVLDPAHNATSNPEDQLYLNQNMGVYFLFFKNNNGVAPCQQLMLGYAVNGYYPGVPFGYKYSASNACQYAVGLFCSMIPAGSDQSFGNNPAVEGFLCSEATKIHGAGYNSSADNGYTVAYNNAGSTTYHAQVVTDGNIVVFRINKENYMGNMWFVGPVIKTLAHPAMDNACTSQMLSKVLSYNNQREGTEDYYDSSYERYEFWQSVGSTYNTYQRTDFFDAEKHHMQSADGHGIFFTSDSQLVSSLISNSSIAGFNRWAAVSCGVMSADPTTHYIVQGDGLKGYLDTNFLRCVRDAYSIGQTFDDGNFVYIGNSIAMGWDPSNGAFNG